MVAGIPLPSGTITFAFTDIVGSTRRWERDRAAMQDAVRRNDAIVRAAVSGAGGRVFKAIGDAFCCAFARPEDAVVAMLDLQRALAAEDFSSVDGLPVRAALHTGTADERDGDYFGPAVNRVARLLALAHGGQVVASGAVAGLVREALPPGASLVDLGEHRLEDLARPEHVFGVVAADAIAAFPPLRSVDASPNNLPNAVTSFVGRESEVAEIGALLDAHRFVCIAGAGGIGKTRVALAVAANRLDRPTDGVWLVELAPLASGTYIASTVAQALGAALPAGDPLDNLARMLAPKRATLVLDNCEHVAADAAALVHALLQRCPNLTILATSRQGLGVAGEQTYRLPSLAIGDSGDSVRSPAVALFADRARAIDSRFAITEENVSTVIDICRRLDGIPLAIELAAARLKILGPRQLENRLDERFRLLTSGNRGALPRQQTLRALMDWSHDLLDARERAFFRRIAIFANGFAFEGALAVGDGEDSGEIDAIDVLGSLVDKSLVTTEPAGEALRYRLLESTQAYAREKLADSGERSLCAEHHLRYLLERFASVRERCEATARRAELHAALAMDLEDVRAALDYAESESDAAVLGALLLAETSGRAWATLGISSENHARASRLLAQLPEHEHGARALLFIAIAFFDANDGRRARALESTARAVVCARASGDRRVLAQALLAHARHCATLPDELDAAQAAIDEAGAIADLPREYHVRTLHERAFLGMQRGDFADAARAYERLREEHRALGNSALMDLASLGLAEVEHARGRTREAVAIVNGLLPDVRTRRDRQIVITLLANLAGYHLALDELDAATEAAREVVRELIERDPAATFLAVAIEHLALALALGGEIERAAILHGFAEASLLASGFERLYTENATRERLLALLAERLGTDDRARLEATGAALEAASAAELALGTAVS